MKLRILPNNSIATFLAREPFRGMRMNKNRRLNVNNS